MSPFIGLLLYWCIGADGTAYQWVWSEKQKARTSNCPKPRAAASQSCRVWYGKHFKQWHNWTYCRGFRGVLDDCFRDLHAILVICTFDSRSYWCTVTNPGGTLAFEQPSGELLECSHVSLYWIQVAAFLESVGVEANDIGRLMKRSPEVLGLSIDDTLRKKIKVLEDLGVRRTKLGRIIWFFPEILSMSVESALIPRWGHWRHL